MADFVERFEKPNIVLIPKWLMEAFGSSLLNKQKEFKNYSSIQNTLSGKDLENFIAFQGTLTQWYFAPICSDFTSVLPSSEYSNEELSKLFSKEYKEEDIVGRWTFQLVDDVIFGTPCYGEHDDTNRKDICEYASIKSLYNLITSIRPYNYVVKTNTFKSYCEAVRLDYLRYTITNSNNDA